MAILINTSIIIIHVSLGNTVQPITMSFGYLITIPCLWFQSVNKYKIARNWLLTGFFIIITLIYLESIELKLNTSTEFVFIIYIPLVLIFLDGRKSILLSIAIMLVVAGFIVFRFWLSDGVNYKTLYGKELNWFTASITVFVCMNFFKKSLVKANLMIANDREKLVAANNSKNFLFGVISHDVRSPLNILKQYLRLDPKHRTDPDQFMKYQGQLINKVDTLSQTIDDLLFWSKSQLQGIQTNPIKFSIATLTANIIDVISETIEEKKIDLIVDHIEDNEVYCDKNHLSIILRNLIQNAIKFTPERGELRIYSTLQDNQFSITVEDNGKGMDENTLKNLREGTIIESSLGSAGEVGTGLGLSLVKELVAKNNGQLVIDSQPLIGTKISIVLPKE